MKSLFRYGLFMLVAYVLAISALWHRTEQEKLAERKTLEWRAASDRLTAGQAALQQGFMTSELDKEQFHSNDLMRAISYVSDHQNNSNFLWQDRAGNPFAFAAMGMDRNHYFANSFLVGYEPYKTDKLWQPLVTLALRKSYQFDHDQYGAQWQDVWQNSQQAYFYSQGDCEDHAILLADWLISMGYDARVVIGKVPSGGHAWVILFHDDKEYLLEATNKRRPRSTRDFMLAKYAPDYRPEYLFNREAFWVNTGTPMTTSYRGLAWKKTAVYQQGALTQSERTETKQTP